MKFFILSESVAYQRFRWQKKLSVHPMLAMLAMLVSGPRNLSLQIPIQSFCMLLQTQENSHDVMQRVPSMANE